MLTFQREPALCTSSEQVHFTTFAPFVWAQHYFFFEAEFVWLSRQRIIAEKFALMRQTSSFITTESTIAFFLFFNSD